MVNKLTSNILRFILVIVLQVAILNNIDIGGYAKPFMYILFILLLPFETPKWLLLVSSFFIGIIIDIFSDSIGIHAFTSVFIAFLRPYVLQYFAPSEGYFLSTPLKNNFGLAWFVRYITFLTIIHSIIFFFLEAFSFEFFFTSLLKAILSSIFTIILIIISRLLTAKTINGK
jgi:rod shape-determining protein MreD